LREKATFSSDTKEIERHLDSGDWILAEYWTNRVMNEYEDLIRIKWEKKEFIQEKIEQKEKQK
jgi:hypothetical protein